MNLSVILCTHNPRSDFLSRTLATLRAQTLPLTDWEFVLIDNHSKTPFASTVDLSWHPRARVIREDELGLTPARLRGIAETTGELLLFVDDDNLLQPDYLAHALAIARETPDLGAFSGSSLGEFETAPASWAQPYLCYLALRTVTTAAHTRACDYNLVPMGAGLCVHRRVATTYATYVKNDPRRRELDRRGNALTSGGDSDLAFTAIDLGLQIGIDPRLSLKHLMPSGRVELAYLARISEAIATSSPIVLALHGVKPTRPSTNLIARLLAAYRLSRQPAPVRHIESARARGTTTGLRQAEQLLATPPASAPTTNS